MNRTLMNMTRSMMFFKNVKLMFWGYGVVCETYLRNRSHPIILNTVLHIKMSFGNFSLVRNKSFGFDMLFLDTKGTKKQTW